MEHGHDKYQERGLGPRSAPRAIGACALESPPTSGMCFVVFGEHRLTEWIITSRRDDYFFINTSTILEKNPGWTREVKNAKKARTDGPKSGFAFFLENRRPKKWIRFFFFFEPTDRRLSVLARSSSTVSVPRKAFLGSQDEKNVFAFFFRDPPPSQAGSCWDV